MEERIPVPKKPLPSIPVRKNDARRRTQLRVLTPVEALERMSAGTDPEVRQKILEVHKGQNEKRNSFMPRSSLAVERSTVSDLKSQVAKQLEEAALKAEAGAVEAEAKAENEAKDEAMDEAKAEAEVDAKAREDSGEEVEGEMEEVVGEEEQFCEYFNEDDEVIEIDGSKALALWDFNGERETDLSFARGAVITVIRRYDNGWWEGELEGAIGDFPCNFVELRDFDEDDGQDDVVEEEGEEEKVGTEAEAEAEAEVAQAKPSPVRVEPKRRSLTVRASAVRMRDLPIKTGFLTKQGHRRKNWKVRHFVLQPGRLLYYATAQDHMANKKPKGEVLLLPSVVVKIAPEMRKSNCFAVEDTTKPFTMYMVAPTGEEMLSWMEEIAAAM